MSRCYELTDEQWNRIEAMLPKWPGDPGGHGQDNRLFVYRWNCGLALAGSTSQELRLPIQATMPTSWCKRFTGALPTS